MSRRKNQTIAGSQQPAAAGKTTTKRGDPTRATAPKGTKQQIILGLLGQPKGTTIDAIMNATGWQQHSVRGFLAGTIRKKLGLTLASEKVDDQRVYRVLVGKPAKSRAARGTVVPSAG